ncbi:MAG: formylglycine-generating enzyme family protein, partial [Chitinivibrionales bacterium]
MIIITIAAVWIYSLENIDPILKEGMYRIEVSSGEEFTGRIKRKTDTSLVIESRGEQYKYHKRVVMDYKMLAPPPRLEYKEGERGIREFEFDSLVNNPYEDELVVTLMTGTKFKGEIVNMTPDVMKMRIQGESVVLSKDIIGTIKEPAGNSGKSEKDSQRDSNRKSIYQDTVYVSNDNDSGSPLMITGRILNRTGQDVLIRTDKGMKRRIPGESVVDVKSYTEDHYEERMQEYRRPLFCPKGMVLVDVPPGNEAKPFFKVCIDRYEYPNKEEAVPKGGLTFEQAREICRRQGKRLCTDEEWQWACSGVEGYTYTYGHVMEEDVCNREGEKEPSGEREGCMSKFGVYDMTGNLFEWVAARNGSPLLMGGPESKCYTVVPGGDGLESKPLYGVRCCKGYE